MTEPERVLLDQLRDIAVAATEAQVAVKKRDRSRLRQALLDMQAATRAAAVLVDRV